MLFRTRNQQGTQGAQPLMIRPSDRHWRSAAYRALSSSADSEPYRFAATPAAPGLSGFSSILACFCVLRTGTVRGPIPSLMRPCALYLLLFAAWAQAFGQVSVLDHSFQVGAGANDAVDGLVVQANGRILAGGEFTSICGHSNSFLARLNADGSVDTSFNPAGQTDAAVQCLLQQPDRKVLVGGGFGCLLGQARPALARLLEDGSVDAAFDASAVCSTNTWVYALALQADGRLLVGYRELDGYASRVVRLTTNGAPDLTFVCTNQMDGYVFSLLPQPDGGVLFGGIIYGPLSSNHYSLFRLKPDGRLDDTFDAGLDMSSVFCMVRQTNGQVLVGGLLNRTGSSNGVPLLRLNTDLQWDDSFQTDAFGASDPGGPSIYSLLLQTDGKIVAGGHFFEVGGYWRRHILRFTPEGHVDGCFDPRSGEH